MKRTPDVIHDALTEHIKGGTCTLPKTSFLESSSNYSTYPSKNNANSEPNPLAHERKIVSLLQAETELKLKKGDNCWAYSTVYDRWVYGTIIGENICALYIQSSGYLKAKEEAEKKGTSLNLTKDDRFFANRISKDYKRIYK